MTGDAVRKPKIRRVPTAQGERIAVIFEHGMAVLSIVEALALCGELCDAITDHLQHAGAS
jgi:hypothetical protein